MKKYCTVGMFMLLFSFIIMSCSKTDGYYDFENQENLFEGNTIAYFESKPQAYDSLMQVLSYFPALKDQLATDSLTVFAPTNASFQSAISNLNLVRKNQKKSPLYIKDLDRDQLDTLVSKYIVKGLVTTESMLYVDGLFVNSLSYEQPMHAQRIKQEASGLVDGGLVTVYYSDTKGSNFTQYWTRSATQAVNIKTQNGVVHILAGGHEFGFGEFLNRVNL